MMLDKGFVSGIPCIDALVAQVKQLHEDNGSFMSKKEIKDQAWTIRYLFGVLKQLTYKDSSPTVPCCKCMHVSIYLFNLTCCMYTRQNKSNVYNTAIQYMLVIDATLLQLLKTFGVDTDNWEKRAAPSSLASPAPSSRLSSTASKESVA